MNVELILVALALLATLGSIWARIPLWVAVLLLCLAGLSKLVPMK